MSTLSERLSAVFRENVQARLDELGWRRVDLATEMGVTPGYISQVMGGHCGVGLDAIERFANVLDIEPSDLLKKLSEAC